MPNAEPKVGVFFGDLHCGSTMGLLKPGFVTHEGNGIKLNEYQEWMWEAWTDCWKWAKKVIGKDSWFAVNNGDSIDGNHHHTREIWSPDEADHMASCADILSEALEGASEVYLTEGTNVHVKNMEHGIARRLKNDGIKVRSPKGMHAWPELKLEVAGARCEVDHHMSVAMRSYLEASALSITLGDIRNQRARTGGTVPKLIVRSHRHRFGLYEDGYGMMIALPPWQGITRFTRRVVPGAVPQVGLIVCDWRTCSTNETPVVHKRLHTLKSE